MPQSLYLRPLMITKPQAAFRQLNTWLKGFVGGRGCIAPETKIRGVCVADISGQPEIATLFGLRLAETPFVKGRADLYRVRFGSGLEVVVTDAHRFLTPAGWLPLSCLRVGSLLAVGGASREDFHSETGRDWQDCYFAGLRLSGELSTPREVALREMLQQHGSIHSGCVSTRYALPPRLSRSSFGGLRLSRRGFSRLPAQDARELSQMVCCHQYQNALLSHDNLSQSHTILSQCLNRNDSAGGYGSALCLDRDSRFDTCETNTELTSVFCRQLGQFEPMLRLEQPCFELSQQDRERLLQAWDSIACINFERHGEYYDLHVPGPNHYTANGIWNHNSGKSYIGALSIYQTARNGDSWMVVSPDNNMIRDTTLPTFIDLGGPEKTERLIRAITSPTPRAWIRTLDGGKAEVVFKGAEKPDKLRGSNQSGLWFDEASIISEDAYKIAIATCRKNQSGGSVLATFTPRGFNHWTFKNFYRRLADHEAAIHGLAVKWFQGRPYLPEPDTALVHCRSSDNPFLPPGYEARVGANCTTLFNAQELGGEFVEIKGLLFRREWFQIVDDVPIDCARVRFWDKANTPEGDGGCYTVGTLMARDKKGIFYVEDVVRGRWTWHDRNRIIYDTARVDFAKYGGTVTTYLEQEGGDSKAMVDMMLVQLAEFPVYRSIPSGGQMWKHKDNLRLPGDAKVRRAMPFAAACEAGNVRVKSAHWVSEWCEEHTAFPEHAFADQVDSASSAYQKLAMSVPDHLYADRAIKNIDVSPQYGDTLKLESAARMLPSELFKH